MAIQASDTHGDSRSRQWWLLKGVSYFYLLAFVSLGVTLTFVIPPFQVPDENVHWVVAYDRVEKHLPGRVEECSVAKMLPQHFEAASIAFRPQMHFDSAHLLDLNALDKSCDKIDLSYGTVLTYPGVVLARALISGERAKGNAALKTFYLSRLLHGALIALLLWRLLALSLKAQHWNFGVLTLLAFCLSPLLIQQSFAVSADVVVFALSLSLINIILNWEKIKWWDGALFLYLMVATTLTKPPAFSIVACMLVLLLFAKRQSGAWSRRVALGTFLILGLGLCMYEVSLDHSPPPNQVMGRHLSLSGQLQYIRSEPQKALETIDRGMWERLTFPLLSGPLGWLDTKISPEVTRAWQLLICFSAALELVALLRALALFGFGAWTRFFRSLGWTVLSLGAVYLSCFCITLTLYLTWNTVGSDKVIGLQARYFFSVLVLLPVLAGLPLVELLGTKRRELAWRKPFEWGVGCVGVLACLPMARHLTTIFTMLMRDLLSRWW